MQEESTAQPVSPIVPPPRPTALELRTRDRFRKLISKIDSALKSIEGTYGYCEETGEPISLKRLEARPIATLSVEAQERHEERLERTRRDEGTTDGAAVIPKRSEGSVQPFASLRVSATPQPSPQPALLTPEHAAGTAPPEICRRARRHWPLHSTTSMPLAGEIGLSKVAVSITVAGSNTQMSA